MWLPKNATRQQKCWSCICGVRCAKSWFFPTVSNDKLSQDMIWMPHLKTGICLGGKVRYGWTAHILIANGRYHFVAYIISPFSLTVPNKTWLSKMKFSEHWTQRRSAFLLNLLRRKDTYVCIKTRWHRNWKCWRQYRVDAMHPRRLLQQRL